VGPEGLGTLKINHLIRSRTRDLVACSTSALITTLPRASLDRLLELCSSVEAKRKESEWINHFRPVSRLRARGGLLLHPPYGIAACGLDSEENISILRLPELSQYKTIAHRDSQTAMRYLQAERACKNIYLLCVPR
jgi:hypothetical protein